MLQDQDLLTENDDEEIIIVSKSEIKRDAEALKRLGLQLVNLNAHNLAKIPLDERLLAEIKIARNIKREGLRRQIQYIGKILRSTDVKPIQDVLDTITNKDNKQAILQKKLELQRQQLIDHGDAYIETLLQEYPNIDRQQLRNLVRLAQKEVKAEKPAKAYREIFKYLTYINDTNDL